MNDLTAQKQSKSNLPAQLKANIEAMSGFSMDDVRVHYNSSKPAQMKALAYTQGTDIHVGPGQEKHLGHEAWHVVQQKQGRVAPTAQLKGVNVNTDSSLEHEANVMGARASVFSAPASPVVQRKTADGAQVVQMTKASDMKITQRGKGKFQTKKEWTDAAEAIKNNNRSSFKVQTQVLAKELLELGGKGHLPLNDTYTNQKDGNWYEIHPDESKVDGTKAPDNDLPHIKWKDNGCDGHIFFNDPNPPTYKLAEGKQSEWDDDKPYRKFTTKKSPK